MKSVSRTCFATSLTGKTTFVAVVYSCLHMHTKQSNAFWLVTIFVCNLQVADRDGNGMVSLPELQLFALEHQKLTNDRAGSAASQMFSLVSRLAKEQLELDLCEFIKAYAKDLSKQRKYQLFVT